MTYALIIIPFALFTLVVTLLSATQPGISPATGQPGAVIG